MTTAPIAQPHGRTKPLVHLSGLSLGWTILAIGAVLALVLALPGQTITTKYVNDLFIFLDGAYRIAQGQVPNRDFHSSLGPLAFYIPALGYGLSGSLGAAMPVGMGLTVLILSAIGAHLIATRMQAVIGVPLAVFLLLIAAVPLNPGEGLGDLSFAMFYNRLGWTALGLLLVLYLPPLRTGRRQGLLDGACAAALVLFLLYLKASYGLVAVAFVVFMLFDRQARPWAAAALAGCALLMVAIEPMWRGSATYLGDVLLARDVSGELPGIQRLTTIVLQNLADVAVYAAFAVILLVLRRSIRDLLFVGFCGATGILLIEQNFQIVGILTLGASAAVIAQALAGQSFAARRWRGLAAGTPLFLAILMLPVTAHNAAGLMLHTGLALTRQGEPIALPNYAGVRLVQLTNEWLYGNFARYNRSLADGAEALASLDIAVERVVVLDFVGPFSAGLNLVPPRDDSPWYHWGRTLNEVVHPPAAALLGDAQIIMEAKWPIEIWTARGMRDLYANYLDTNFTLVRESQDWRIYRRKPGSAAVSRPADSSASRQSTSAQP